MSGGEFVYANTKTWQCTSGADWQKLADTGAGHSVTAIASQQDASGIHIVWADWCGSCNPGSSWAHSIMTNYGGIWHQLTLPSAFPGRYIVGVTMDPTGHAA